MAGTGTLGQGQFLSAPPIPSGLGGSQQLTGWNWSGGSGVNPSGIQPIGVPPMDLKAYTPGNSNPNADWQSTLPTWENQTGNSRYMQQRMTEQQLLPKQFESDLDLRNKSILTQLDAQTQMQLQVLKGQQDQAAIRLKGAYDTLTAALSKGFIDPAQAERAKAEYAGALADYNSVKGKFETLASQGMYTPEEMQKETAAGYRGVEDRFKSAAENTYNQGLGKQVSPFAAADLMTKGATEAGKARVDVLAGLTREQAQSRMSAATTLAEILKQRTDIAGALADIDTKVMPQYVRDALKGAGAATGINVGGGGYPTGGVAPHGPPHPVAQFS